MMQKCDSGPKVKYLKKKKFESYWILNISVRSTRCLIPAIHQIK